MINATKKKSCCNNVQYIYSICILNNTKEALELFQENGNEYWKKAIMLKIQQLVDINTFQDKGFIKQMPSNYTKI